ncbi:MAG: glyoxylate/hydroxypyruvate reductase A [Rhodobacteraceae bacterium]|nr:glyoxylate/hydroxypyruvate reductase A [Paracoccaceae bacterium]MBR9820298.1 glyoxylate/hydroxypyruvate reductase A [Paracoccaceae bacterium]
MINVLFAATAQRWSEYEAPLRAAFAARDLQVELRTEFAPEVVDYIIYAPNSPLQDFTPYTRCKAVLNLWAGVEAIVGNDTLTQPLTRMVDHGLSRGMVEWVSGHVLRHHLDIDHYLAHQDGDWDGARKIPPLAEERPVTILGLGELGRACAEALSHFGFPVTGWSRSQKEIPGITCLSGEAGLAQALASAQVLVLLLPLTEETTDLLDADRLAQLPEGAVVLNPGRGPMIVDEALIAALDSGHLRHATLDVFREEPLPPAHPFWAHPKVTVCPHIASETRPRTAAQVIAENIARGEAGEPLKFLVDRDRGY